MSAKAQMIRGTRLSQALAQVLALASTAAIALSGCSGSGTSSNQADLEGYAITTVGPTQAASNTCFTISNSDSVTSTSWTVQDPNGTPSSNYLGCGTASTEELCCSFQTTGSRTVVATVTTAAGSTLQLSTVVNVSAAEGGVPAIVIDVETAGAPAPLGTISQDPVNIPNAAIPSLSPSQAYTFDFHRSEPNAGGASTAMNYQISYGTGYSAVSGTSTNSTFAISNIYPVSVMATNSLGNTAVTNFQIFVQCADASDHAFTLDASALHVTPGAGPNLYDYDLTGIRVGGVGTDAQFNYLVDFNGDGIFDTAWIPLSQPTQTAYVLYVSGAEYPLRPVTVMVWDTQCNIVQSLTVPTALSAPSGPWAAPSAASPSFPGALAGYDFLQADVDWLTPTPSASAPPAPLSPVDGVNLSFLGTRPQGTTNPQITCSYTGRTGVATGNPAVKGGSNMTFMISAQTSYIDSTGAAKPPEQMQVNISGIQDLSGETGTPSPINLSAATLTSVSYQTDESGDIQPQYGFVNDQACSLANLSIQTTTVPVCNGSEASTQAPGYTATVIGDFSCAHLANTTPVTASAAIRIGQRGTGHFSCRVPVPNPCLTVHDCLSGHWEDTGAVCCTNVSCPYGFADSSDCTCNKQWTIPPGGGTNPQPAPQPTPTPAPPPPSPPEAG